MEPLVGTIGPASAIVLILITPLVWSSPTAVMAAEMTAMMPEEGGYTFGFAKTSEHFGQYNKAAGRLRGLMLSKLSDVV